MGGMAGGGPPDGGDPGPLEGPEGGFRCDFCGREVAHVRRVALDRGYERLQTPHQVRYACPDCSERKERQRRQRSSA